jgi:outer membrane immunogenic protein
MRHAASALALIAALGAGAARAADLPSPKTFEPPPPAFGWSGFYTGLNMGGGWTASDGGRSGVLGGGQIGYNHQLGPLFVVGVETDFQGTSFGGGDSGRFGFGPPGRSRGVDWFGTARGRIGLTPIDPQILIYGTGGFAYGDDGLRMRDGWTAGGGLEWAFAPRWSVKGEYLYTDLGRSGPGPWLAPRRPDAFHTVRAGVNYHFDLLSQRSEFMR